jgi:hypothetical protein
MHCCPRSLERSARDVGQESPPLLWPPDLPGSQSGVPSDPFPRPALHFVFVVVGAVVSVVVVGVVVSVVVVGVVVSVVVVGVVVSVVVVGVVVSVVVVGAVVSVVVVGAVESVAVWLNRTGEPAETSAEAIPAPSSSTPLVTAAPAAAMTFARVDNEVSRFVANHWGALTNRSASPSRWLLHRHQSINRVAGRTNRLPLEWRSELAIDFVGLESRTRRHRCGAAAASRVGRVPRPRVRCSHRNHE